MRSCHWRMEGGGGEGRIYSASQAVFQVGDRSLPQVRGPRCPCESVTSKRGCRGGCDNITPGLECPGRDEGHGTQGIQGLGRARILLAWRGPEPTVEAGLSTETRSATS